MPFDHPERRTGVLMASVVDGALDLATQCGWRYAIAYLISERVPAPIIQRLLAGGGNVRGRSHAGRDVPCWRGSNTDQTYGLFESLNDRHPTLTRGHSELQRPSRVDAHHEFD